MKEVKKYVIDYRNLNQGLWTWEFTLSGEFFQKRGSELIAAGEIEVRIELEKKITLGRLTINHTGWVKSICDRCLDDLDLDISGETHLIVKELPEDDADEDEVLFTDMAGRLQLADAMYDYISLSVPMIKYCDTEPPCHTATLSKLEPEDSEENNPTWNELRKLKF